MCNEATIEPGKGSLICPCFHKELLHHLTPVHLGLQHLIHKTLHVGRHLAHHLGCLRSLGHLHLPLSLLLLLLGRATVTVLTVIQWATGFTSTGATALILFRQDVVDALTGAVPSVVDRIVVQSDLGHPSDTLIGQQLVDHVVSGHVPASGLPPTTSEVVLQHGMEALVGNEELDLLISQAVHKLGVELDPLAVGGSGLDALIELEGHT